ncbi:MAG: iron-sulfur cluster carrier protein ApbC [Proteobacteria bacterium]|nr:iron-sulfur cluster carrier protein ApbC [Pseudomonadota bacterium]
MAAVTEEKILEALKGVVEPESGTDIVTRNMVSGVTIKDGNVGFALEVDPEKGQAMEPVRKAAEAAVDKIPGVLSVTVVMTAHRDGKTAAQGQVRPSGGPGGGPSGGPAGGPAAGPQGGAQQPKPLVPGIKHIVAVASGKGGVGKSTVAVNLALALSANGHSVALLDADIYGPSQPRMMGLAGEKPVSPDGDTLQPMEKYGIKLMSIGFLVDEDTPMIWRGPMVMSAIQQFLRDVNWGECDIMIVDMPPGTGDAQLTLAQQVPLAGAVIVSTPQDISLIDARKGLNMFRKVEVPVLGIIENMSYFLCPSCGHQADIFGHGGAREEATKLGVPFLGEIPLHMEIRETSDGGEPIVVSQPDGPHAETFRDIAHTVWDLVEDNKAGKREMPNIVIQ